MEYMYYMHTKVHIHCPTLFNIARKILCRSEEVIRVCTILLNCHSYFSSPSCSCITLYMYALTCIRVHVCVLMKVWYI